MQTSYSMACINNKSMTPGTPRIPTIIAFSGLMTMYAPNNPPTKLNRKSAIPPIIPFNNSFIKILIGTTKSFPTTNNKARANKKANTL